MKVITVGEIGLNHDGSLPRAKRMIALCKTAGVDYVKFQTRDIEKSYTKEYLDSPRESQWGKTVRDEKRGLEFTRADYQELDNFCREQGIRWFSSPRDVYSAKMLLENWDLPWIKVASGMIPDRELMRVFAASGKPLILSTGMAYMGEIDWAIRFIEDNGNNLEYIMHAVSIYPCPADKINMRRISTLQRLYGDRYKIGYSNHSVRIVYCVQAAAMGCQMIEFHVSEDRALPGTDQKSSIGPEGVSRIVKHIRSMEEAWGTDKIIPYKEELDKGKNYQWRQGGNQG